MSMGVDSTKPTYANFEPVFDKIDKAVQDGQIRKFTGNDYVQDLDGRQLRRVHRLVGRHRAAGS